MREAVGPAGAVTTSQPTLSGQQDSASGSGVMPGEAVGERPTRLGDRHPKVSERAPSATAIDLATPLRARRKARSEMRMLAESLHREDQAANALHDPTPRWQDCPDCEALFGRIVAPWFRAAMRTPARVPSDKGRYVKGEEER